MYNENDYIIYRHDVCKIKEIKKNDKGENYYILIPLSDETLKMSVPVSNNLGYIKSILTKEEALKLIDDIKDIKPISNLKDKYIENKYKELLNSGKHEDLIKIIKTSYLRNKERLDTSKKISEKDKNYFEKARVYLYNELSISLNMSFDDIDKMISNKCNNDTRA